VAKTGCSEPVVLKILNSVDVCEDPHSAVSASFREPRGFINRRPAIRTETIRSHRITVAVTAAVVVVSGPVVETVSFQLNRWHGLPAGAEQTPVPRLRQM
jgi:hypothetical protein